ncbi:MAG TPA: hypothetical protein VM656_01910 [Pyrinomonadaceae bacterium]|nr:hypothetical protein [Pyrinomonadaceae bacterium]
MLKMLGLAARRGGAGALAAFGDAEDTGTITEPVRLSEVRFGSGLLGVWSYLRFGLIEGRVP